MNITKQVFLHYMQSETPGLRSCQAKQKYNNTVINTVIGCKNIIYSVYVIV